MEGLEPSSYIARHLKSRLFTIPTHSLENSYSLISTYYAVKAAVRKSEGVEAVSGDAVATSSNVFSTRPTTGTITKNQPKYNAVATCPTKMNGCSTCIPPRNINKAKSATKIQKATLINGLYWLPLIRLTSTNGITNKINRLENMAITPNNLLGIDLKIA